MVKRLLRSVALLIAGSAVIDPSLSLRRVEPLAVEMPVGSSEQAARVRDRLLVDLDGAVSIVGRGRGEAVVAVDADVDAGSIRDGVPVSFVALNQEPNVRLQRATFDSPQLFPGERSGVSIDAVVVGLSGKRSRLAVLQDGIEIGATEQRWAPAGHQRVSVPFVAMATGSHRVQIVATPLPEERRSDDNVLDATLTVNEHPFSVAFMEYRPTWAARFVREALESDPRLRVSSVTRVSRGIDVRSGNPPALTASALDRFDVLAVGAPEELRASEISELRRFMALRGGSVVLLPDRRPAGVFSELIPAAAFDELLLRTPATLSMADGLATLRGSEFAIPRAPAASMRALGALPDGKAVVVSWPIGAGTLIVCGGLDAWRYRASDEQQFASFWRAVVAGAARRVPPPLSVELDPPISEPGARVQVTARVRRTEFEGDEAAMRLPPVTATAQPDTGSAPELVRLWPTSEAGLFAGEFVPSERRKYTVLVNSGRARAAAVLLTRDEPFQTGDEEEAEILAAATGGVVATSDRLAPLLNHLQALPRGARSTAVYPMRSPWWIAPFTMALCAEWVLRRRRGQR